MKVNIKLNKCSISYLYIVCLTLASCWEVVMPTTYFDEILLILFLIYIVVRHIHVPKRQTRVLIAFVVWALLGLIMNLRINLYSLFVLIDSIKPILLLLTFLCIKIDDNCLKRIVNIFCLINIPSALLGITNGILYNYLGKAPLFDSGSLKYVDGELVLRSGGLVFISGVFTDICAISFICVLFMHKRNKRRLLLLVIFFLGAVSGKGRFPLLLLILGICFYIWNKINRKLRNILMVIACSLMLIAVVPIISYIIAEYAFDIENQIRFLPYKFIFIIPLQILFFGVGIGNIGSTNSFLNNPDLFYKYGLQSNVGFDWEAQFGKMLVQTGLVGTVLWSYPFISGLIKAYKSNKEYRNLCLCLIGYYLINLLMNKSYEVQILILVCSAISYVSREEVKLYGKY